MMRPLRSRTGPLGSGLTQRPMYRFLIMMTVASTVGLQTWRTLFNNFAVETVALEGRHIGVIQSVREIPGFLALLAIYILLIMREHRLSALAIVCLGLGVTATGLYYFLTFMSGARRQIFIAFAVFLMVKKFDYTVQQVTILFVVNNSVNYFLSPLIGKGIIRFGERRILSLEYGSLIIIFLAYAIVQTKWIAALLYVLDHIFFNFAIAIRTYFQKIGDPQDIAPSMAVGFTINHIAAVVFPVVGGLLWMIDYRIPFVAGAVMSLISLCAVQRIRVPAATPPPWQHTVSSI